MTSVLPPPQANAVFQNLEKNELIAREMEIARLHQDIAKLNAENLALHTLIERMRRSASWRISFPVRIVGTVVRTFLAKQPMLRKTIRSAGGNLRGAPMAMPLLTPANPPSRYVFIPFPPADADTRVVTLNTLYHLSRSL